MTSILIYGGSLDPPHLVHLNTALAVQSYFNFDKVCFLPCKKPVLKKESEASTAQRVEMLQLAISSFEDFEIDLREIDRQTPSYFKRKLADEPTKPSLAKFTSLYITQNEWCSNNSIKCHDP